MGHLVVWSVLIINSSEVSPFSILLIFFWPVADTGLAIWRRKSGNPRIVDRLHFQICVFWRSDFLAETRHIANPIATTIMVPLISFPQFLGVLYWNNNNLAVLLCIGVGMLFILTYSCSEEITWWNLIRQFKETF